MRCAAHERGHERPLPLLYTSISPTARTQREKKKKTLPSLRRNAFSGHAPPGKDRGTAPARSSRRGRPQVVKPARAYSCPAARRARRAARSPACRDLPRQRIFSGHGKGLPIKAPPAARHRGLRKAPRPFPGACPPLSSVIMMPKIIRSPGVWRKTVSSFPGQHWGYRSPGTWENTLRTAWAGTTPELPRRMGRCTREKTHLHLPRHDEARCPAPAAPIRQGLPAFPARRDVPALLRKGYSGTCPLPHAAGHASPAETYAPRRSRPRTAGRLPVPAENTNVGFPCAPEPLPFPPWKGGRMGMAAPRKIPVRKMPLPRLTCPPFPHAGTCLPFCKKDILGSGLIKYKR